MKKIGNDLPEAPPAVKFTTIIDRDLLDRLRAYSAETGIPIAAMLRKGAMLYLAKAKDG
jgi:hypothetical protein